MSAADDYPAIAILVAACDAKPDLKEPEAVRAFREIDRLRAEVAFLRSDVNRLEARRADAINEGDRLRAEVARLKAQLDNEREAAEQTIQHVRSGGRL